MIKNFVQMCRVAHLNGTPMAVLVAMDVDTATALRLVKAAGGAEEDMRVLRIHGAAATPSLSLTVDVTGKEDSMLILVGQHTHAVRGLMTPLRFTGHKVSPSLSLYLPEGIPLTLVGEFVRYVLTGEF